MNCRFCGEHLRHQFIDLNSAPPSNAYLSTEDLNKPELYFPLRLFVCDRCWLVQTQDYSRAEDLFKPDYAYFSSTSTSWVRHSLMYCNMIIDRLGIDKNSFVIEIASNDGYLLKNFVERNIPCLGIEPTNSTADMAEKQGIPVLRQFFGSGLAEELRAQAKRADLVIGNNVYAHVPDISDFTKGLKKIIKSGGTITLEFPHLMRLIDSVQFDTIYHEHYSYLSLYTVCRIFESFGLKVFDVEELSTHGGSLRIYGCHADDGRIIGTNIPRILAEEQQHGLRTVSTYRDFQHSVDEIKNTLITFLIEQKLSGKKIAAYGAAAKGNTLLNYAGIKQDLLPYVCDAAESKQNKFLPGSHIPILAPEFLKKDRPDIVLILPWNIADEIIEEHKYVYEWGGVFVTMLPEIRIHK